MYMILRRPFLLVLASLLILGSPLPALAEIKVLTAEATYTMGDGETPSFAEAMVLQKAKQIALEQAGTYVESYTKVQNLDLTTEEIQTIAGGVLQVEVLDKSRTLIGDGLRFFVKIKATVTTDKMEELAHRIKGKNVVEEYKKLQGDYARLGKEIETWKQLIVQLSPGQERTTALDQIREREKTFSVIQKNETAFFQRLVSGKALIGRAQDERALVDSLIQKILEQGHLIAIGEPTLHKIEKDPINGDMMKLRVPATIQTSKAIRLAMKETAQALGGSSAVEHFVRRNYPDDTKGRATDGIVIKMGRDEVVSRYFRDRVAELTFVLNVTLENGEGWSCTDTNGNRDPYSLSYLDMNPISPVVGFYAKAGEGTDWWGYIRWVADDGKVLVAGSQAIYNKVIPSVVVPNISDRVVAFDDIRSFSITMTLPASVAQQIKGVNGGIKENPILHPSILMKAKDTAPEQPPQEKLKEIATLCNIEP